MTEKMTWDQMKQAFPNEWLLITDFRVDKSGHLITGKVERHSKNKTDIFLKPKIIKSVAFRFTGESNFSGIRKNNA